MGPIERAGRAIFDRRSAIFALALIVAVAIPGASLAGRLRARLPDPWNDNRHFVVIVDSPAPPPGTPLLRLEPSLAVIGVIEGPSPSTPVPVSTDAAVRVSVFPEAVGLVREDSRIDLRIAAPDLLEVVLTHFTPERRARLVERIAAWRAAHEQAIDASLVRLRELADKELGADELGRKLWTDPALRGAIQGAFEREVFDPINWDSVVDRALQSQAADSTFDLLKHAGPVTSGWAGLRAGYRARWSKAFGSAKADGERALEGGQRALRDVSQGDIDEALLDGGGTLGDVIDSAGASPRMALDPAGWFIDHTFSLLVPDSQSFKDAAARRAAENIRRALPARRAQLARDWATLGQQVATDAHLEERSVNALKDLGTDAALRDDIGARYGPEARLRVERYLTSIATDPRLQADGRAVVTSGLDLLAGILRELALDDAQKGPNPLLVAFVRARLLNRAEPVLILREPGSGAPAKDGSVFVARRPQ